VIDKNKHRKVNVLLNKNWAEKHIRGGLATKNKYKGHIRINGKYM
jgi:hypothetical protein